MNTEILAKELAAQLQSVPKGAHIVLCELLRVCGGSIELDPAVIAAKSAEPTDQLLVEWEPGTVTLTLK